MMRFLVLLIVALPATTMADVIHLTDADGNTAASVLQPTTMVPNPSFTASFDSSPVTIQLKSSQFGLLANSDTGPPLITLTTPVGNPDYLTNFIGSSANGFGTGNGSTGTFNTIGLQDGGAGSNAGNGTSIQLTFSTTDTLGPTNRLIFYDVDPKESVTITAFDKNGNPLNLSGWVGTQQAFVGNTGLSSTSTFAKFSVSGSSDGVMDTIGTLGNATATMNLGGALNVLTPDQEVYSLVITDGPGGGGVFFTASTVPEPSSFVLIGLGAGVVLAGRALRKVRARHVAARG